ncbi:MAG TPA: bifunctional nuclease family protein [Anaerolineaceae bacterium]|jgi:bifunctional DNase/RNase|nr:bifunctional nuclease family protein [Anaerolineaceae bacterium]
MVDIDLIEATIDSIRMSLTSQQRIIILKDANNERYLPIWIGPYESESITIALQEIEISRPQTHDLIKSAIDELGGSINRIIISELKDDIFYGIVEIVQKGKKILLDTRPSDALALAVRTHVPIFISEQIMKSAGITPVEEEYVSTFRQDIHAPSSEPPTSSEKGEKDVDRLSVFEEYLQKLDQNGEKDDNEDDEKDEDDDSSENMSAI